MHITINGEQQQIQENGPTIEQLLSVQNVESPDMVSVQVNGEIIDRANFKIVKITENDEIDFLYFMGGGA